MKSNLNILIWDHRGGCYLNVAQLLSPHFNKTWYYSESRDAFPHPSLSAIGTGFEDQFTRIASPWLMLDQIDLVVFPDGGFGDIAAHLRKLGKLVFGASNMDEIEANRGLFHQLLEIANLPTAPTVILKGITNLSKWIRNKREKWIKVSKWRNLMETYHWIDYQSSKFWLDELSHRLGPLGDSDLIEFVVQDPIKAVAEIGSDGYTLNGQVPQALICGIESKDCGYAGKVFKQIPKPIQLINEKIKPILSSYRANGFYSTEIRYTADGESYYTDICSRAGSPPSSSYLANITNWGAIIPSIAKGEWVEPEYNSTYMVELILKSNYATTGYLPVSFPPEFKDNLTFKGAMKDTNGQLYIVPFENSSLEMEEIGSVIVNDNNLDNAIARALEIASQVKCYEFRYEQAATDIIKEEIKNLENKLNINF